MTITATRHYRRREFLSGTRGLFRGELQWVEDDTRQGRLAASRNENNVARIREIVQQDRTITVCTLSNALDISMTTCHQILHENLGKRKLNTRLVPHSLTQDQKDARASVSADLLSEAEKDAVFIGSIIAEDETWCSMQSSNKEAERRMVVHKLSGVEKHAATEDQNKDDTDSFFYSSGVITMCSLSCTSREQYLSLASVQDGRHSCRQCTYVTKFKSRMQRHLRKHTGERPFQCHLCTAAFFRNTHLAEHIRTHTGERPFSCDHCNASFSQKWNLVAHMRIHTGERPFSCDHCNASFSQKQHLVVHMRTHTGERPFSCDHCNASFSQKQNLVAHMCTHTGERPFSCDHCNASFSQKQHLVDHMRTHTGECHFSCDHCNASFSQKHHLMYHVSSLHANKKP
ncbi:zinc finger protein OZF-like [Rhipicephalus sanguineus]|uniref:zinc finger protein OZF-like n=1 Tax=Rhipicephalus sanguineus TaxID=34632 RepID=UPI001895C7EB|nr:zinc finger protein OZF-like [Rhipicephalus sanguineus]